MKTKHVVFSLFLVVLLVSCAVESKFGQVQKSHLSGCNTGADNAPARMTANVLDESEEDTLSYRTYVRVKALDGGSYSILAQYQVNCCPTSVDAHLYISDSGELQFCFEERLGIDVCDCMCPLRCESTLVGMKKGVYPVKIYYNGELSFTTSITLVPGVDEIKMLD